MPDMTRASDHLRPADIVAFVRSGPGPVGDPTVAHLAQCGECREEVLEVSRLVRAPASGRLKSVAAITAAAAMVAAAWLGVRPAPQEADRERATPVTQPDGGVRLVAPLGPLNRDAPIAFTWRGVAGAVEYRLTLLDARGNVLWSNATIDTAATLPIEISLVRGPAYYWFVDVLQSDGSSATSGSREFRLER